MKEYAGLFLRALICLLGSLLFTLVLEYLLSEILVHWYMWSHGVEVRSDLSEDMGLGMLGFLQFIIGAPIFFMAIFWFLWKKVIKLDQGKQSR